MKKSYLFGSAAAVCLLLSACSKEEAANPAEMPSGETERIYLAAETGGSSRAGFAGEGYAIAWSEGDMVSVNATKAGGSRNACPVKCDEKGAWYIEAPKADIYHVVYPAIAGYEATDDTGAIIGNHVYLNDRDYQIYTPGSFDPERLVCYGAAAPGEKLTLRYMVALLKLTIRGAASDYVTAVTVTGGNDENIFASIGICGMGTDGYSSLSAGSGPYKSQTLRVEQTGGVALDEKGVDFYLALFPMTLSKGFTVKVDLADGMSQSFTASKTVELKRGRILAMPAFRVETISTTAPVSYSTDNLNWMPWEYASGTTPAALPYPETADHILYFRDNAAATGAKGLTLAHLQYLHDTFLKNGNTGDNTAATAVAPIGFDCSRATYESTTLPENIFTRSGDETNKYSTDLRYVSLPNNIAVIPGYAFAYNQVLRTVILPAGVTEIGTYAFYLARGFTNTADDADPAMRGVFCYAATPPTLGYNVFKYTNPKFHVPAASLAAYEQAWTQYAPSAQTSRATLVGDL